MYSVMASFLLVAIVAAFTPLTNSKPSSLDVDIVPALPQEELSQTHIIHRRDTDYYRQALKALIPELVDRLAADMPPAYDMVPFEDARQHYSSQKRKAFWQPMSGPLPVETRLASFGSRIEANKGAKINPNILKAMRYGK